MICGKINENDGTRSFINSGANIRVKTSRQARNNRNKKRDFARFINLRKKTYYDITETRNRKWELWKHVSTRTNCRGTNEIL